MYSDLSKICWKIKSHKFKCFVCEFIRLIFILAVSFINYKINNVLANELTDDTIDSCGRGFYLCRSSLQQMQNLKRQDLNNISSMETFCSSEVFKLMQHEWRSFVEKLAVLCDKRSQLSWIAAVILEEHQASCDLKGGGVWGLRGWGVSSGTGSSDLDHRVSLRVLERPAAVDHHRYQYPPIYPKHINIDQCMCPYMLTLHSFRLMLHPFRWCSWFYLFNNLCA